MKKNWLEWSIFSVSCCIIVGILGILIFDASNLDNKPPLLTIEIGNFEQHDQQFLVPFTIHNTGDHTAENVIIEISAADERTEMTIAFVPRGSERKGWVVFDHAPQQLTGRILGYEEP